jgi:hypothetical protein
MTWGAEHVNRPCFAPFSIWRWPSLLGSHTRGGRDVRGPRVEGPSYPRSSSVSTTAERGARVRPESRPDCTRAAPDPI